LWAIPSETTVFAQWSFFNDTFYQTVWVFTWNINRWKQSGEKAKKEGEGEREQQISRVKEGALQRSGNGVGWKWSLAKEDTWVFLTKQINRLPNKRLKLGWISNSLFHWCLNIRSHNDMFHHTCSIKIDLGRLNISQSSGFCAGGVKPLPCDTLKCLTILLQVSGSLRWQQVSLLKNLISSSLMLRTNIQRIFKDIFMKMNDIWRYWLV